MYLVPFYFLTAKLLCVKVKLAREHQKVFERRQTLREEDEKMGERENQVKLPGDILIGQDNDEGSQDQRETYVLLCGQEETNDARSIEICRTCGNYKIVAKIVVAVVASNPHHSEKWLRAMGGYLLTLPDDQPANSHFIFGVILGLFKAANWLDKHWKVETAFTEELPAIITGLIVSQKSSLTECTEYFYTTPPMEPKNKQSLLPKFESQLSQEVKDYVHGEEGVFGGQGKRRAKVQNIIDQVFSQTMPTNRPSQLSKLGEIVADQIAYAFFGSMGCGGRLLALNQLWQRIWKEDSNPAPATAS